jgi:hypothetical protein
LLPLILWGITQNLPYFWNSVHLVGMWDNIDVYTRKMERDRREEEKESGVVELLYDKKSWKRRDRKIETQRRI